MFVYFTQTTVFSITKKRGALTYKAMLPLKNPTESDIL